LHLIHSASVSVKVGERLNEDIPALQQPQSGLAEVSPNQIELPRRFIVAVEG
jgi:hypothetical protein